MKEKHYEYQCEHPDFPRWVEKKEVIITSNLTTWNFSETNLQNLKQMAKKRTKILPENAKQLSPDLAYLIGVIYGDGNIYNGLITLSVKDLDFYNKFKTLIEKWSGMKCGEYKVKGSGFNSDGLYYKTVLASVEASSFLKNFEFNNIKESTNKEIIQNFLKGIFDSEGWVIAYNLNNLSKSVRQVGISMIDKDLILVIQKMLLSLDIKSNFYEKNRVSKSKENILIIGGKENILNFQKQINFSIKRKQDKLNLALNSYVRK